MIDIGMSWGLLAIAMILVMGLSLALLWQTLRYSAAKTYLNHCQLRLEHLQERQRQEGVELRELTAAVRAEKAHVEQLQRQLGYAREEAARKRATHRKTRDQ